MATMIKKLTFNELHTSFNTVLKNVDKLIEEAKIDARRNDRTIIWEGKAKSLKTFLTEIEKQAIEKAAEELKLTENTIKERWRTLMMPHPIYSAIESGTISYTKIKAISAFNLDIEKDHKFAQNLIAKIIPLTDAKLIKKTIEEEIGAAKIWNESDVAVRFVAYQHAVVE